MLDRSSTRIGITIFCRTDRGESVSWWANGANLNCAFLWLTLKAAGYDAILVNGGDGPSPEPNALPQEIQSSAPFAKISDELVDTLDILIQAGAQISAAYAERVHARGGKVISFKFGSDYPIDAERAVCNLPSGAIFNGTKFDEIWTTTQHIDTCGAYWEIAYRAPVRVLPHIWHPCFVNHAATALVASGIRPGYVPGRTKKRIMIMEPNIQLLKTCHIPMLICEAAWRRDPSKIDRVLVVGSGHMMNREAFTTFAKNLDTVNTNGDDGHPVMSFEPRYSTPWLMAAHGDVVVSHQWITFANYSHYDLLHLGYPIVHNVPEMRAAGVGYYYPAFNATIGAAKLLHCMEHFDTEREYEGVAARTFLETRIATSRANVEAHARAVEEVRS